MEPAVRSARTRSGLTAAPAHEAAPLQAPELGWLEYQRSGCSAVSRSATAAGNGIFGCRDRAPKTVAKMCERLQRQKSEKRVARNARRNALFGVVPETFGLRRLDGGVRSQIRTGLHLQFPANREINREFRDSGPSEANFVARNHCAAAAFYEIPYAN